MQLYDEISIETHDLDVLGQTMCISLMAYHAVIADPHDAQLKIGTGFQRLAEAFKAHPANETQGSACVITDLTPALAHFDDTMREQVEAWFSKAEEDNAQTQRYLYQLFGRPVFQIWIVAPGTFEPEYFSKKFNNLNPSVEVIHFVPSLESALVAAHDLLRIAHNIR